MAFRILPDAELLVTGYLRGHSDVAALVGTRVSTALPPEPVLPAVTVNRVGGVPSLAGYLDDARLEIYAWADTKGSAEEVARTVEAAMWAIVGPHPEGTVTNAVETGDGLRWDPDSVAAFQGEASDKPRYLLTFDLYLFAP